MKIAPISFLTVFVVCCVRLASSSPTPDIIDINNDFDERTPLCRDHVCIALPAVDISHNHLTFDDSLMEDIFNTVLAQMVPKDAGESIANLRLVNNRFKNTIIPGVLESLKFNDEEFVWWAYHLFLHYFLSRPRFVKYPKLSRLHFYWLKYFKKSANYDVRIERFCDNRPDRHNLLVSTSVPVWNLLGYYKKSILVAFWSLFMVTYLAVFT